MGGEVTPQWDPPPSLTSPHVCRLNLGRFDWEREIRGWLPYRLYGLALMLATYGDKDGQSCHPGELRLADSLMVSTRTVREGLGWLDAQGWITREFQGGKAGSRRGYADIYRLTMPAPYAVKAGLWKSEWPQWVEHKPELTARAYTYGDRWNR
jgi:hypothetical protein